MSQGIRITVGELKEILDHFTDETLVDFDAPGDGQLAFHRLQVLGTSGVLIELNPPPG